MWDDRPVPHIRLIEVDEATGPLRDEYDAAIGRAGKVFNVVKSMSLRPGVLKRSRAQTRSRQTMPRTTMPRTTTGRPTWSPRVRALCDFAVKLTAAPASVGLGDADALRSHGLDDAAIHDNRIAEAGGIEDEPEWADRELE